MNDLRITKEKISEWRKTALTTFEDNDSEYEEPVGARDGKNEFTRLSKQMDALINERGKLKVADIL